MAQSRAESTWEINNYRKCINQFPPNTVKSIRQYERNKKKICWQKMSIIFNEICINEEMLPIYIYILLQKFKNFELNKPFIISWLRCQLCFWSQSIITTNPKCTSTILNATRISCIGYWPLREPLIRDFWNRMFQMCKQEDSLVGLTSRRKSREARAERMLRH